MSTTTGVMDVGPIRVSSDGRYFVDQNETPFFWLGDTQWQLFRSFTPAEVETILENIRVLATGTQIQENEKGEPAPVDVYTLEVSPEEGEKLALAAAEGKLQMALRSAIDGESVYTTGVTIPQLLASYSKSKPSPKVLYYPKPVETKAAAVVSKPKKNIRRWKPRPSATVEIIKGTEVSHQKFSM